MVYFGYILRAISIQNCSHHWSLAMTRTPSYLKLCLSEKHSEFKQTFPTPTEKFQQSQCQCHIFLQGGDCFHTQLLCAGHFPLFPHFYAAFTHFTGISLLLAITGLPSLTAPESTPTFGICFLFSHIRLLSSATSSSLFVLQSWLQSSCVTLRHIQKATGGHVPWVLSWNSVHMALFLFQGCLQTC